jgi:hypothetical protein
VLKTKLNTTGTFSIGKAWELDLLKGLEVLDVTVVHFCNLEFTDEAAT